MVFSFDEEQRIVATIDNTGKTEDYQCVFRACENPVCTCNIMQIDFNDTMREGEEPKVLHSIPLHVVKQELAFNNNEQIVKEEWNFGQDLLSRLQEEDWQLIRDKHYQLKNLQTEYAEVEKIRLKFNYIDVEHNQILCSYNEALPYGDYIYVQLDGKNCYILDQYCLRTDCNCTDMYLSFYHYNQSDNTRNQLFTVFIDYASREWKSIEDNSDPVDLQDLARELERQHPDLLERFARRHARLKSVYTQCKQMHYATVDALPEGEKRNAPCPCGSGRRYKNCCMKPLMT